MHTSKLLWKKYFRKQLRTLILKIKKTGEHIYPQTPPLPLACSGLKGSDPALDSEDVHFIFGPPTHFFFYKIMCAPCCSLLLVFRYPFPFMSHLEFYISNKGKRISRVESLSVFIVMFISFFSIYASKLCVFTFALDSSS